MLPVYSSERVTPEWKIVQWMSTHLAVQNFLKTIKQQLNINTV